MFPSSCIYSRFVCGAHTAGTSPGDSTENPGGRRRPAPGPGLPDVPGPRATQPDLTDRAHHRLRQDLRTTQGRRKYPINTVAPLLDSRSAQYNPLSTEAPLSAVTSLGGHCTSESKCRDMSNLNVCMLIKERLPLNTAKHVWTVSNRS